MLFCEFDYFLFELINYRREKYPVHAAAQAGDIEQVKKLLSSDGATEIINALDGEDFWSCLHYASFYNYPQLVLYLLTAGANPGTLDQSGRTALHLAAGNSHLETVEVLLKFLTKEQVNIKSKEKQTALQVCIETKMPGFEKVAELLRL